MNHNQFIIDKKGSVSTALEVPAFPWVRTDAGCFIWEEALYNNNYLSVHHSAIGRCQSRENIYQKLMRGRFPKDHLLAFEVEADGELLCDGFRWEGEKILKTAAGFEELVVELAHERLPLTVNVHTLLDGTSFLVRWLDIKNRGNRPCCLSRVFPWAGIIGCEEEGTAITPCESHPGFSLGQYRNECWGMEGEFAWTTLSDGTFSVRTMGNKYHPPFFAVQNHKTGELTLLHVECTLNTEAAFTQAVEKTYNLPACPWGGRYLYAKAGLGGRPPLRVLQPGETAVTPAVHVGMVHGDLDDGVNRLYEHLRASVIPHQPKGRENLVEYNHTGYTLNAQISRELLHQEVDMAAEIGVELFLVDAGWYGPKEKNWGQSIGDWVENPILGKGGLNEVFEYARSKGMKCGLWMPPEMVSGDTPVQRAHPDWFLPVSNTFIFDLLNSEVEEYVYSTICAAVERFGLDCFRIDGGLSDVGEQTTPEGFSENISWRYYEKLNGIYERVHQRFPNLLMENCSGGGGRSDLGMLRHFHYTQVTDNWDPACQIRILNGMTLALTPQQCMPLVGSINMRTADLDFVIRTGLFGHFTASGVFPNLQRINPPALAQWKHAVEIYKKEIRPILPDCRVYHHTPVQDYQHEGDWVVLEYASRDGNSAVVGLFRLTGSNSDTYRFIARGLDMSRDYLVMFGNTGATVRIPGLQLCTTGIAIRIAAPLMSELLIIRGMSR